MTLSDAAPQLVHAAMLMLPLIGYYYTGATFEQTVVVYLAITAWALTRGEFDD